MKFFSQLVIIVLISLVENCSAYYQFTHKFLGSYLANNIRDVGSYDVINNIEKILPLSQFSFASTWADKIKHKGEYSWSASLHYIDINECKSNKNSIDLDKYCKENCIYTAILNMTESLRDRNFIDIKSSNEDLKFLLHFLQDLHQPLHLNGWSRGGNSWKINLKKNSRIIHTNFHTLWDSYIPEFYINKYNQDTLFSNVTKFSGVLEYIDYLKNHIEMMSRLTCNITRTINHEIDFDEYFTNHLDIIKDLFRLYIQFSIDTILFIFD